MGQQIQGWRSAGAQRVWLSTLIDTMEQVSRPERRAVPCVSVSCDRVSCDRQAVAALRAQLARPAAPRPPYGSAFSLRN
jgi:hypothetical protein